MTLYRRLTLIGLVLACGPAALYAQTRSKDLALTSLEDLMKIEITSASRHEQPLLQTSAAIYVVTREDIRRSGLRTLPEVLRLVPGVSVARIDGSKWAISARGFNTNFTNKMLVIVDGRSAHNRLFGGVYWEIWDIALEEIERIEVVRGPGASTWGDNAVNGIINIVTRSTAATQGGMAKAGFGSAQSASGEFRYGGELGTRTGYRIFAKRGQDEGLRLASGDQAPDRSTRVHLGGRIDHEFSDSNTLTVQASSSSANVAQLESAFSVGQPAAVEEVNADTSSASVQGRWSRTVAKTGALDIFGSFETFDHVHTHAAADDTGPQASAHGQANVETDYGYEVANIELHHRLPHAGRHAVIWGAAYRHTSDHFLGGRRLSLTPDRFADGLFTAFGQDTIRVLNRRGHVTVGSRITHHEFSGWGWQPTARFLFELSPRQSLWAASSRALRTPSRADRGLRVNQFSIPGNDIPVVFSLVASPEVRAETLLAFETGYRATVGSHFSMDIAGFVNEYDNMLSTERGTPLVETEPAPRHLLVPLTRGNLLQIRTAGIETSAVWTPVGAWRLEGTYSVFSASPRLHPSSTDTGAATFDGNVPRHTGSLRSRLSLPHRLELDANVFLVGALRKLGVPAYTRLDLRLGWSLSRRLELSLSGQNLLSPHHPEFFGGAGDTESLVTEVPHSVHLSATWRF